jgi:hypothetical protein
MLRGVPESFQTEENPASKWKGVMMEDKVQRGLEGDPR